MKDSKYLLAYIVPIAAFFGLYSGGILSFSAVALAFIAFPILELILPQSKENLTKSEVDSKLKNRFFDLLLYLNVPLIYSLVGYLIFKLSSSEMETFEIIGNVLSVGTVLGMGINVAHELGHRFNTAERVMAELLLLPNFYMHFIIEHNFGHHIHVSTPKDPATARFNENLYKFWIRSVFNSYLSAWKLEKFQLGLKKKSFWSMNNKMIWFTLIQTLYVFSLFILLDWQSVLWVIATGVFGFLLLETINYIEHYGLVRGKTKNGNYERVKPKHSWNSNYELGRIVLYELTRHSDHHFIASKKYQVLDHHDEAPQLPVGYPAAMLMSLLPPLWFGVMNPRVEAVR